MNRFYQGVVLNFCLLSVMFIVEDNYIYLSNMTEVKISLEKDEPVVLYNKKSSSSNHTAIIIVCVVVGVVVLGGLSAVLIYILKKNKKKTMDMVNNSKISNQQINDSYKSDVNLDKAE